MAPFYDQRSTRLAGHDYTTEGLYFVTICTADRRVCPFGEVVDGEMRLNEAGQIAHDCWIAIPEHFSGVTLDTFVIMPNHVHGIVTITAASPATAENSVRATHASPLPVGASGPRPGSLGAVVGSYKSAVSKRINDLRQTAGAKIWQRGYHDEIIHDHGVLDPIRRYIQDNPAQWQNDVQNPNR